MATRKEKADQKKKPEKTVLADAPEAIGTATGKVASPPGASAAPPGAKSMKKGKLLAKHKARLPRRLKKAQKKAAARL